MQTSSPRTCDTQLTVTRLLTSTFFDRRFDQQSKSHWPNYWCVITSLCVQRLWFVPSWTVNIQTCTDRQHSGQLIWIAQLAELIKVKPGLSTFYAIQPGNDRAYFVAPSGPTSGLLRQSYRSELTFVMFNAGMMSNSLWSEAETENVAIIWAVTHEKWSVWLIFELHLCLLPAEWTPVPATLSHAQQLLAST